MELRKRHVEQSASEDGSFQASATGRPTGLLTDNAHPSATLGCAQTQQNDIIGCRVDGSQMRVVQKLLPAKLLKKLGFAASWR